MLKKFQSSALFSFWNRKNAFLAGLCFLIFIFSLVLTLNLAISLAIFILSFSLVIFAFSFSRGWLFLLMAALLFSALRVGEKDILFFDLCLLSLILIGLFKVFLEKGKLAHSRYDLYFLAIVLLSLSGVAISHQNTGAFHPEAIRLSVNFFFYWFLFLVFQYFFQTEKRIRRFFWALIFCSLVQSLRGLVLFWIGTQTQRSILSLGVETIAPFLLVGIFSSWGMWNFLKKERLEGKKVFPIKLIQVIFFFQLAVFALISSSTELVFLGLGFLFLGILSRDRRLVLVSAFLTLIFSFFVFYLSGGEDFSQSGLKFIRDFKTASASFLPFGTHSWPADFFRQNNSYFYFWGNLGILGIISLTGLLFAFFSDVYGKYKKSDGEKRIWLMAILGILIAFLMMAFRERVFFSGSSAVIFWLLAGVVQNLNSRQISFGLTETRLDSSADSLEISEKAQLTEEPFSQGEQFKFSGKKNLLDSCQSRFDFYQHQ